MNLLTIYRLAVTMTCVDWGLQRKILFTDIINARAYVGVNVCNNVSSQLLN